VLPMTHPAPAAPALDAEADALHPADLLTSWFGTAAEGDLRPRLLRLSDGRLVPLPVARWAGPVTPADETMLTRAHGPVLDVGCGPGRLTAALHTRGTDVLGLELLTAVPVLARQAGAPLHVADVFDELPRTGSWRTVLLADGNIGIGGDPLRLLRRVRDLLVPDGRVLCELMPYGDAGGHVRLEGLGATSAWFAWGALDLTSLPAVACAAGLRVADTWTSAGRVFAELGAA
jgi:SAM-dependent methyltransferase